MTGHAPAPAGSGPDIAARVGRLAGAGVREVHRIGEQHRWGHYRVVLADGRQAFAKMASPGFGPELSGRARKFVGGQVQAVGSLR